MAYLTRLAKLEHKWALSAGKIIKGDGARVLRVDTKGLGRQKISATVEVYGLDPAANREGSCTTLVVKE